MRENKPRFQMLSDTRSSRNCIRGADDSDGSGAHRVEDYVLQSNRPMGFLVERAHFTYQMYADAEIGGISMRLPGHLFQ
jgi:hypothetical protein